MQNQGQDVPGEERASRMPAFPVMGGPTPGSVEEDARSEAFQTLYDEEEVDPPRPVQLVWKNWPRGRSARS
jgi:hypothetical protein